MMLVIQTQVYENYGTRWKAKGGSEYKVLGVPLNIDYAAVVAAAGVEQDNDSFREHVISWSVEANDYLSEFERSQLEYEGKIVFPEPAVEYADLVAQHV